MKATIANIDFVVKRHDRRQIVTVCSFVMIVMKDSSLECGYRLYSYSALIRHKSVFVSLVLCDV